LEARVDPPHLTKELAWLRAKIREAGHTKTTIEGISVTPGLAEAALFLRFKKNRDIDQKWVDKLVVIIKERRFRNFEALIFDWDGDFREGQHRMSAVIKAGKSIDMGFTFGVDPAVFPAINVGRPRSAAQFMRIDNVRYAGTIAAIVRFKYRIEHSGLAPDQENVYLLGHELNDDILLCGIAAGSRVRKQGVILSSAALAYRMIATQSARHLALGEFWDRFAVGDDLKTSNPVFKLRAQFEKERRAKERKAQQYLTQAQHAAWIILAWNAWAIGQTAVSFRWSDENALPAVK
jgi:ribosome-binding factor A